jgi:hypothetical protein
VSDSFQFRYRGETDSSGRLTAAVVRYDGDGGTLARAADYQRVTASFVKADKNGNPRIRITGGDVQAAIRQYAQRASAQGRYTLGGGI